MAGILKIQLFYLRQIPGVLFKMAVTKQLQIGKIYSFDTYAPEVLGTRIANAKCLAVLNAQNAISNGVDIFAYHEQMRPHLPVGYNNDPMTMIYVKLVNSSGLETIYSMDWINLETLQETRADRIIATIDGVSIEDIEIIRRALAVQGYNNFNLVLTES